jgi:hypothetical protein
LEDIDVDGGTTLKQVIVNTLTDSSDTGRESVICCYKRDKMRGISELG